MPASVSSVQACGLRMHGVKLRVCSVFHHLHRVTIDGSIIVLEYRYRLPMLGSFLEV